MRKPPRRTFEEIMNTTSVDPVALDELERRAQKRMLAFQASYTLYLEDRLPTVREQCDAAMQAATACLHVLQALRQPQYKPYIEYLDCVARTGCFPRHETVFLFIKNALLQDSLPAKVIQFVQAYSAVFAEAALAIALDTTIEYLKIIQQIHQEANSKLDPSKSQGFIRVFGELFYGLQKVSNFVEAELYVKCFCNVKLSLGLAVVQNSSGSPASMDKLEKMTTMIVMNEKEKDTGWLGFVTKVLKGLDILEAHFQVLVGYEQQKKIQNIEHEIVLSRQPPK